MISSVWLTALLERRTNVGRCTATALGIYIPVIVLGRAKLPSPLGGIRFAISPFELPTEEIIQ